MKTDHRKDDKAFRMTVICIIAGAVIGSVIGALGLLGVIPQEYFGSTTEIVIKICIGLIVLIVDLLFIWAICQPMLRGYIDRNGVQTNGEITTVREIPCPDQLYADEWVRKLRYSCTVKYCAGGREYNKEFPPTHLTSKRELYPFALEEGMEIPVRYLRSFPSVSVLDVDVLKNAWKQENQRDRKLFILIPLIITAGYLTAVILL